MSVKEQRYEEKNNKNKKQKLTFIFVIFAVSFLVSALLLGRNLWIEKSARDDFSSMADGSWQTLQMKKPSQREISIELYEKNKDMAAWIAIDGTKLSYPVMHTPKNQNYYLKRNFDREYSPYGVPFISADCKEELDCHNIIVYGHYVKNGDMFGLLQNYKNKTYWEAHPIIQFTTVSDMRRDKSEAWNPDEYRVISIFKTDISAEGFPYYDFQEASNEAEYYNYVKSVKALSLYDTGVDALYGEQLLTLSTCEYSTKNGRLVIVAKKINSNRWAINNNMEP